MSTIVQIVLGAFTGWLAGKAFGQEGYRPVRRETHVKLLDAIYGIIGAMIGEYLFFWVVIGDGDAFSDYGTVILGSVTVVGAARLIAGKIRAHGFLQ
ncbi:MAG TPA: hypothetical protein VNO43_07135 [Candidatus Eisenbacteria bacterium]|nr:hypothetical protein [Candidatus Eisenbacteria bacterium]